MHSTAILLAALPAALASVANRQVSSDSAAVTASAVWSDECLVAEESFAAEIEAIETGTVAPELQSYLATVTSTGITNYCEPTDAPATVSAEWVAEIQSIDAIINVYSSDISQVQSCLESYQTAAGTPYQLAYAASLIFNTISSLQACTSTSAAAVPTATGAGATASATGSNTTGKATGTASNGTAVATATPSVVTAGASRGGLMATGAMGLVAGGLVLAVSML